MPFDPSGVIPAAGALGSAALQQHYALKNWKRTNEYNTPKAQVGRLKDANLPLAAMFGGSGGSTSSAPSTPNVDPTLGTAAGLQASNLSRFQRKQMEIMDQELRAKTADADIKEHDRDNQLAVEVTEGDRPVLNQTYMPGDSNYVIDIKRERALKELELQTKGIDKDLKQIDLNNKPEMIRAQIDHILRQIKINDISIAQNENYSKMLQKVSDDIIKGGTGLEGVGRLVKAWFYKLLLR